MHCAVEIRYNLGKATFRKSSKSAGFPPQCNTICCFIVVPPKLGRVYCESSISNSSI